MARGPVDAFDEAGLVRQMIGRQVSLLARTTTRATSRVALELRSLGRAGEFDGVSLALHAGEVLGVAGLIGSGRSELAQAVFGHTKPTAGTIALDGRPVGGWTVRRAVRRGVGFVPEERASQGLFMPLTVRDNVGLPALDRISRGKLLFGRRETEYVAQALASLRLRGTQDDPVSSLSGGNQQKVLLARWIGLRPEVMILDEPTRGIDVGARADIYRIIDGLTSNGIAVLLISSDIQELLLLSDRIVVMREGRLVAEFTGGEMTEEARRRGGARRGRQARRPDDRRRRHVAARSAGAACSRIRT